MFNDHWYSDQSLCINYANILRFVCLFVSTVLSSKNKVVFSQSSLVAVVGGILSSSSKTLFQARFFWYVLKLEVMLGRFLIGCQEDSKYFHAHAADTRTHTHTQQIHPGLIGQIGFPGW